MYKLLAKFDDIMKSGCLDKLVNKFIVEPEKTKDPLAT